VNETQKENYAELQMLNNRIQQLQQQLANADKQFEELKKLDETLDDFSKVEPGTGTLSAIGSGIFAKTEIKDTKEVIMAAGSNVYVTKPVADAKKFIEAQTEEVGKVILQIESAITDSISEAQALQQELQQEQKKKSK